MRSLEEFVSRRLDPMENPGCREGRIVRPFARRKTHAYKRSFSQF
jgi:hypothetical protein